MIEFKIFHRFSPISEDLFGLEDPNIQQIYRHPAHLRLLLICCDKLSLTPFYSCQSGIAHKVNRYLRDIWKFLSYCLTKSMHLSRSYLE